MSFHHWMYFGCQCSSARCRRLLLDRLTLFGIFSAEIMVTPRIQHNGHRGHELGPFPIEFRPALLTVNLQRAFLTDRVRPLEDPVLPRRQPSEDLRLHRL